MSENTGNKEHFTTPVVKRPTPVAAKPVSVVKPADKDVSSKGFVNFEPQFEVQQFTQTVLDNILTEFVSSFDTNNEVRFVKLVFPPSNRDDRERTATDNIRVAVMLSLKNSKTTRDIRKIKLQGEDGYTLTKEGVSFIEAFTTKRVNEIKSYKIRTTNRNLQVRASQSDRFNDNPISRQRNNYMRGREEKNYITIFIPIEDILRDLFGVALDDEVIVYNFDSHQRTIAIAVAIKERVEEFLNELKASRREMNDRNRRYNNRY